MRQQIRTIDEALLHVLRERGLEAGHTVPLYEIAADWRATGLRRDDLFGAIERFRKGRCLRTDTPAADVSITLEPEGQRRIEALPTDELDFWRELRRTIGSALARYRRVAVPEGSHRRSGDAALGVC